MSIHARHSRHGLRWVQVTGLDVLALMAGSTVGASLGVRAWRRSPDNRADRVATEGESAAERMLRGQCDSITVSARLADEGFVDRVSLDRASLLHDIATRAGCPAERAADQRGLVVMAAANPSVDTPEMSRAPQAPEANGTLDRSASPGLSPPDMPSIS